MATRQKTKVVPHPSYGIARIDHRGTHGWQVRVRGKSRLFSDKPHGGRQKAKEAAIELRDTWLARLPLHQQQFAAVKKRKKGTGSVWKTSNIYTTKAGDKKRLYYWIAHVVIDGKRCTESFACNKYGDEEAERLCHAAHARLLRRKRMREKLSK